MSLRPIVMWPDPRLTQTCDAVEDPASDAVRSLVADMFETMYAAPGRGLAAPQVGVLQRVFVVDVTWKEAAPSPLTFINPEILETEGAPVSGPEACLSIPGIDMQVARPPRVRMRWQDSDGQVRDRWLEGAEAICAQHELDHLNGRVIFDHQDAAMRAQLEKAYAA